MGAVVFPATAGGAWAFLLLTIGLGGAAAWASGRALAKSWRSWAVVPLYAVGLSAADRFLHFILAKEDLLSIRYAVVDALVLIVATALAYRRTRARQMTTQYGFLFEPAGPLAWRTNSRDPSRKSEPR